MAITVIEPPAGVILRAHDWHVGQPTRAITSAIDGGRQVAASGGDRWVARLDFRVVRAAAREEWRGFVADLRGRLRAMRVRVPSTLSAAAGGAGVTHSDGTTFSDGAPYATSYALVVAAAARARVITVDGVDVSAWRRGLVFDCGGYPHIVTGLVAATATQATVRIAPGLRVACAAGAGLSMQPVAAMSLTDDDSGRGAWSGEQFFDAGLDLVEVFP